MLPQPAELSFGTRQRPPRYYMHPGRRESFGFRLQMAAAGSCLVSVTLEPLEAPITQRTIKAELHAHTTFSDGVLTPSELVAEAQRVGLTALAVTDHDIVDGVAPAREAAAGTGLEVIPGVEFSTNLNGHEVHVLGLFVDDDNDELVAATLRSREFRRHRATLIVGRLNDLGIDIEFAAVEVAAGKGSIGRPHIAQALVHQGASSTLDEAFQRFIGVGRPAFSPKPTLEAAEVIGILHRAGGVAILAHPASSRVGPGEIQELTTMGLDGFEIYHPKHSAAARRKLKKLVDDMGLLPSSGSDFHGPGSGPTKLGDHAVPIEWLMAIRAAATAYRNATGG